MPVEHLNVLQQFDLSGRTALVTGWTGYLGSAIAAATRDGGIDILVNNGHEAVAHDCSKEPCYSWLQTQAAR
ncbi:MAG: hypothetical protein SGI77_09170 [Pirellulaceae bacterium]|nr:hypothetical protein [Pirellulaceae bacterium]